MGDRRNPLFVLALLLALGALAPPSRAEEAQKRDGLTINHAPATAAIRSFDPKNPPEGMPKLEPDEAAVTESSFACAVQVEVETEKLGDRIVRSKIVALRADLRLDIVEWLPKNVSAKIRRHEDAHRQISEIFYRGAAAAAQKIGEKYIGRELKLDGNDAQAEIRAAANRFCEEYLAAVERPSQKAQQKFDELTDHGRNKVPEKQAIQKAVDAARYGAERGL